MGETVKILMIALQHSAKDDRIFYKEALSLKNNGYEVRYLLLADKDGYIKDMSGKIINTNKENVIYIDLLNEYPNWHGYDWLKNELNIRSDINKFKLDNPDANLPNFSHSEKKGNPLQKIFYNDFINSFACLYVSGVL